MSLRAILFDFNGILVDDEPLHLALFQRVLGEEGVPMRAQDYEDLWLGLDDRGCLEAALTHAGRPAPADYVASLVARKAVYYQAEVQRDGFRFFPGALELAHQAFDAGLLLGVVSGALRGEIEAALTSRGARGIWKTVVAAEDVATSKPDPAGYALGLAHLNELPPLPAHPLHPHEVLAIEDSPAGLEAATAVGLRTLGAGHTYLAARLVADRVVDRLDGLALRDLLALFAGR